MIESISYMIAFHFDFGIIINISKAFDSILKIGIIYVIIVIAILKVLYKVKEMVFMS